MGPDPQDKIDFYLIFVIFFFSPFFPLSERECDAGIQLMMAWIEPAERDIDDNDMVDYQ